MLLGGKSLVAAIVVAMLTAALVGGCGGDDVEPNPPVTPDPAYGQQPNFVFVYTDDQDLSSFQRRVMPITFEEIVDPGTLFTNFYDTTPLCCPARAGILTGQYGHNNGVLANKPGYGDLADKANTLPVWLQRAGYQTAIVGKYLNGYESAVDDKDDVAPGWDLWSVEVGNGRGYYDFKLTVNGRQRKERYQGEYLTDVLNQRAVENVEELSGDKPFFLWVTQSAPHVENINADSGGPCGGQAVPPPRDLGRFDGTPLPRRPGVLETDVSDKPAIVSGQPQISAKQRERLRHRYQCRIETLPAVDRGIGELVDALRENGELDETILVFASDNGTFQGQHRLPGGKGLAYEEAAHLPLAIRVPPKFAGGSRLPATVDAMTANIDVAPSFVEWAGAQTCPVAGECRVMDGRSWLALFDRSQGEFPPNRPLGTELDLDKEAVAPGRGIPCSFEGVRDERYMFVRHTSLPDLATGTCEPTDTAELYDHDADPFELDNLIATGDADPKLEERLVALTEELADCAGIEGRDPEPASGNYCR